MRLPSFPDGSQRQDSRQFTELRGLLALRLRSTGTPGRAGVMASHIAPRRDLAYPLRCVVEPT
jgi:hypothetical protein